MEITVIGSGYIGLSIAHRLMGKGHDVRIIVPEDQSHMASTGNASTIASYAIEPVGTPDILRDIPRLLLSTESPFALHRPSMLSLTPWLVRFLRQSLPGAARNNRDALIALLDGVNADWRAFTAGFGAEHMLRPLGAMYAFDTLEAMEKTRPGLERRRELGVDLELVDQATFEAMEPGLPKGRFAGGALFKDVIALTDPGAVLNKLDAATQVERVIAKATALRQDGAGWHIDLSIGETLTSEAVVVAAGAWSRKLLTPLGLNIPLTTERGYHLEFDMPLDMQPLTRPVCPLTHGFYFTPLEGRLRAAGTVELGGVDAPPTPRRWERLEAGVRSVFPDLPPVSRKWMGLRPSMPDSLPVIGMARPGLALAFGHGHIGVTLAPKTAELIERALMGEEMPASVSPARSL